MIGMVAKTFGSIKTVSDGQYSVFGKKKKRKPKKSEKSVVSVVDLNMERKVPIGQSKSPLSPVWPSTSMLLVDITLSTCGLDSSGSLLLAEGAFSGRQALQL